MQDSVDLLPRLVTLVDRAAEIVMQHFARGSAVQEKADRSPVTEADREAEALLLQGLRELTPDVPVVAEEEFAAGRAPVVGDGAFWLVDPLDGTREFISRNGEFTVNVGLIEKREPTLGVVSAPAVGLAWWGRVGSGAQHREQGAVRTIRVRAYPEVDAVAVASRSHRDAATDAWLTEKGIRDTVSAGSSLKFCLVAEGKADVYPRFGPTMEWDTAAGHAVLAAAGGSVLEIDGTPLGYAKPGFKNPGFIARGG